MSRTTDAMTWFRTTFGNEIAAAVGDTPFNLDLLTAIAYQETGYIWQGLFDRLGVDEVLALCVGDTLDAPNRSAFPKTKADLLSVPRGAEMFEVGHDALVAMAAYVPSYHGAATNPNKFCHGYGIFQYDIQFFRQDPDYFIDRAWAGFTASLAKALVELQAALRRTYSGAGGALTPTQMVYVAIAYNAGHANLAKDFKQGYKDGQGVYYGEHIWSYLNLASGLPKPPPATGPALYLARPSTTASDGWEYGRMASAQLVDGLFVLDALEFASFMGHVVDGPDRRPLPDMITEIGMTAQVQDEYEHDPTDPRVYVFCTPTA